MPRLNVYPRAGGFPRRATALLDRGGLLELWNKRVYPEVLRIQTAARRLVRVGSSRAVGSSGLFNVSGRAIPRGRRLCVYGGNMANDDQRSPDVIGYSNYDMSTAISIRFSRRAPKTPFFAYIMGDPARVPSIRQHIVFHGGVTINHACEPNCEFVEQQFTVRNARGQALTMPLICARALRALEPGEELTVSYGKDYVMDWADITEPRAAYKPCMCNGGACPSGHCMLIDATNRRHAHSHGPP